jgi:3'(2'), 5'-bisphosphate nucleotidase
MSEPTEAALAAVVAACKVARVVADRAAGLGETTKSDDSPVTIADFAAQAVIVHALTERLGRIVVVGEEDASSLADDAELRAAVVAAARVAWPEADDDAVLAAIDAGHHRGAADTYWALDPIDGTKGFLRREQYAVCLAEIVDAQPTIGVLGCPNLPRDPEQALDDHAGAGAIYLAGPSGPAFELSLDASAVHPLPLAGDLPDTIVVTHSVVGEHTRLDRVQAVLERIGKPHRSIACDSQAKYALVARAQAHAYIRIPTRPDRVETVWDHAAGAAVAARAGMIVTDLRGKPFDFASPRGLVHNFGVVCAHPALHAEIIAAIAALGFASPTA